MTAIVARGLRRGLETTWILAKAVIPAYVAVALLAETPVLAWLSRFAAPVLGWIGLPGEAALPLLLGMVVNLYTGLGALAPLELNGKEATIAAVILSVAHGLVVETAVTRQMGVSIFFALAVRLGMAAALAAMVHLLWRV